MTPIQVKRRAAAIQRSFFQVRKSLFLHKNERERERERREKERKKKERRRKEREKKGEKKKEKKAKIWNLFCFVF